LKFDRKCLRTCANYSLINYWHICIHRQKFFLSVFINFWPKLISPEMKSLRNQPSARPYHRFVIVKVSFDVHLNRKWFWTKSSFYSPHYWYSNKAVAEYLEAWSHSNMKEMENVSTESSHYLRIFDNTFCFYARIIIDSKAWASADFFPGEGKNILFALKNPKRYYFSRSKSENIIFCPAKGGGEGGQEPPLALPCGRPCSKVQKTLNFSFLSR